ncbi:MAG: hypothetical protein D6811_05640, partial [Alphaproteobacteria bacterium]
MLLALAAAVSVLSASLVVRDERLALALAVMAGAVAIPALWVALRPWLADRRARTREAELAALLETDFAPAVITDGLGTVTGCNALARESLGVAPGRPLAEALTGRLASPAEILARLRAEARRNGGARQEIVGLGRPLRVAVRALPGLGRFLW